ncbi:hypothetical protein SNE40_011389 [Patella caerulea]|uniref:Transposase domain-containing protein n=1 Tax=Patella caerulea TaxID=87958 RepID=A0AAN8JJS8_PATCE
MKRNRDGSGTSFWADRRQILRSSAEHMKKVEEWLRAGDARFVIQPPDSSAAETYDLNLPEGIAIDSSTNNNGVIQDNYSCLSSDCEDEDETLIEYVNQNFEASNSETEDIPVRDQVSENEHSYNNNVSVTSDTSSFHSWYSFDSFSTSSHCSNGSHSDKCEPVVEKKFSDELALWSTDYGISQAALRALLTILRDKFPEMCLPKDPRSLLETQRSYEIKKITGGEYYHFGLCKGISESILSDVTFCATDRIEVQFNIDGLPLFKSTNTQFWPILCRVVAPKILPPFIVGIYSGTQKPADINEYLGDFISDMKRIEQHGVYLQGISKTVNVRIACFICDAPARAFIKQIKGHTAYFSCERCVQRGEWHDKVTLPCVDSPFRTDVSFDEMQDEDHHGPIPTPLRQLSLGLVSQIVLDPMHLVYLGVTRRLIWLWKKGPVGVCRISANKVKIISELMLSLHCYIPREFPRKCRSLYEVDRWKATEFRQFLLYSGILVLKKNLPAELYSHFLLLYVAIFCMSNPSRYISYCEFSRELLLKFVSEFSGHYGRNQLVYNVHNIIHLADDVQRHGTLDSFSAFSFENFLGKLKKMLRKPQSPLPQIIRRLSERKRKKEDLKLNENSGLSSPWKEHNNGPLPYRFGGYSQLSDITWKSLHYSVRDSDNCVQVGTKIGIIRNILKLDTDIKLIFEPFGSVSDFFQEPLPSSHLDIYKVSRLTGSYIDASFTNITCKFVRLPYKKDKFVVIPLVHQFY